MNPAVKAASRMWEHTGHQVFSFGLVPEAYATRLLVETGLDVLGFSRTFATRGVRHVRNSHGNAAREQAQLQVAVRPSDFDLIPQIANVGQIRLIGMAAGRKPARLEHVAEMNGLRYVLMETVGQGSMRLELLTMRIEQLGKRRV